MTKEKELMPLILLAGLFIVAFPLSSILSSVIHVEFKISHLVLVTQYGAIFLAFGKGGLDVIQEFWGKKTRRTIVLAGFLLRIVVFFVVLIGLGIGIYNKGPATVLRDSLRIMVAGEITIMLMEYWLDTNIYQWLMQKFNKRVPAIRSLISNVLSSMITSPILAYIGFWGMKPNRIVHLMAWTKPYAQIPILILVAIFTDVTIRILRVKFKEGESIEEDYHAE